MNVNVDSQITTVNFFIFLAVDLDIFNFFGIKKATMNGMPPIQESRMINAAYPILGHQSSNMSCFEAI